MRSKTFLKRIKTFKNNIKERFDDRRKFDDTYRPTNRDDVTEEYEYEHRKDRDERVLKESGGQDITAI